jgi:two-component system response regulator ResD
MRDKNYKILVVDDEEDVVEFLRPYLREERYEVFEAYNGEEALMVNRKESPDLIILDVMMPGLDGFEICKKVRARSDVPIIMLTAKSEDVDKIVGLEIGADDYMVKPFNPRELIARVKAIFRRVYRDDYQTDFDEKDVLIHGDLIIDAKRREVIAAGEKLELPLKEFDLLWFLARNPGRVYSREQLLDYIWGADRFVGIRTVDVHIRRLRENIEPDPSNPTYLLTVWGVGYKFSDE